MRPYIAIITDSFRAAFASRLLWIVLGAILLLLMALAPIGYREVYTVEFSSSDIYSSDRLTGLLAASLASERPTAARQVAEALPEELRSEIRTAVEGDERGPTRWRYAEAFNALLDTDAWHSEELWRGTPRLGELRDLDERPADELDTQLRRRRARLRLEAAFPGEFRPRPERSLAITYAGYETPAVLPVRRQQFINLLNQIVFPLILYYLLGVGAVFVGVLVTAPIMPEMLQPGALHLLLSKPISRPALYLSKFVGGCAFVLLCVALLVTGLWLIAGFRLEIWNHRLLLCIPIFVFLFAVYYSVSALAALQWRSAIVAVVITVLFWFGCFFVGTTAALFDSLVTGPAKVRRIAVADDSLFVATASGGLLRLAPQSSVYDPISDSHFANRHKMLGPVRLADGRVAAARVPQSQFNVFGSEDVHLIMLDPANDWIQQIGHRLPVGTTELRAAADGGLFAAATGGIFYASPDDLIAGAEQPEEPSGPRGLLGGIQRLLGNTAAGFTPVTPPAMAIGPGMAFTTIPGGNDVVTYARGRLVRLNRDDAAAEWSIAAETATEGDLTLETRLAATADHLVLARKGEPLRVFTTEGLEPIAELPFPSSVSIVAMHGSTTDGGPSAGSVVAALSDRRLARIRFAPEPQWDFPDYPYQGRIEAAAWGDDRSLWLAHHVDRLTAVDPATGEIESERRPQRDVWRLIDAWAITPLRSIVPQTGEVGETVTAIICGRQDVEIEAGGETQREQLNVVRPLATCGVFTAVMLLFGCLYVYRQDF